MEPTIVPVEPHYCLCIVHATCLPVNRSTALPCILCLSNALRDYAGEAMQKVRVHDIRIQALDGCVRRLIVSSLKDQRPFVMVVNERSWSFCIKFDTINWRDSLKCGGF